MSTLTGIVTLACCAAALRAEVHTMNLRQAVERALQQNPEIAMARLDELKAQEAVRVQKDPFAPHVYFGSGLAYTNQPMIRKENQDMVYRTEEEKFRNAAKEIKELNAKGQPVLVGTISVRSEERLGGKQ